MYILWVQSILGTLHVGNTVARSVTRGNTVGGADFYYYYYCYCSYMHAALGLVAQTGKISMESNQDITGFRVRISLASVRRSIGQPVSHLISNIMNINRDVN